ncbi:CD63 antigen-like [Actinia tenebrosa]|uniref:Tetraspanin n=1 Tax=Actinia tenebrosa TaxID=6105 RepID=A0A6P8J6P9_ACTTE|nr:CD63 antigen-like [Actinia tenebrosa]
MAVEGGGRIIKFLVLFFNFLFFVFGIVLLGVGAYAEAKYGSYSGISRSDFTSGSRLVIAVGLIIAVISFFGCCGAWKENKCFLIIFFVLLLVLLILEITAAALAYQHRDEIANTLEKDINDTIANKYGKDEKTTKLVDMLQEKEKCCGVLSYRDWVLNPKYNITSVPDSCCVKKESGCGATFYDPNKPNDLSKIHQQGCYNTLKDTIMKNLKSVAGVAVAILVIQILGMIFAICLVRRIGKETAA